MGARGRGGRRPHLSRHVGAVPVEVVVLPVEGDVVAAPVDGAGAVAHGLGAGPAPALAGAEGRGRAVWSPGLPPRAGPPGRVPGDCANSSPGSVPAAPAGPEHGPAAPARPGRPSEHWGQGRPGRATHQLLQSTWMLSPGAYRSLLCTHGQSCSSTQPPRPSSSSPSGHTQPLTHSVWYWGRPGSGGQGPSAGLALPPRLVSHGDTPRVPTLLARAGRRGRAACPGPPLAPAPLAGWAGAPRPLPPPSRARDTDEAPVCVRSTVRRTPGWDGACLPPPRRPRAPPRPRPAPARTEPAASVWQLRGRGFRTARAVRLLQST